ncbi:MAG TPA: bifunctional DNA-formamidopyrimidine glycosylase/DNA-(apurinic or apyrimidinic site) lyase [Pseudonocardiaceae bacterium]|nr:bifunctional DNA-formamidopyrimidine glycosylase/DNA-(apurinic or apyrimidinic site) lyase [Pseudonocardiaceae bacterium]
MPELPEVEVVRLGLAEHITGRTVTDAEVRHPRSIRRHLAGEMDFTAQLCGRQIHAARRRGKYLWLDLSGEQALLAHLGMSGQMRIQPPGAPDETHLRVRFRFADEGPELRFIDQRTFGGLSVEDTVDGLPVPVAHIARDPLDPLFDLDAVIARMRQRQTGLKRALLDQTLVSGIGNIYADEALWHVQLHGSRSTATLTRAQGRAVLTAATEVMTKALAAGGTSFDALYVNINGASGYFDRSLAAYGQAGQPCLRCGTAIQREPFMNRSSYSCPRCQPRPRRPHP